MGLAFGLIPRAFFCPLSHGFFPSLERKANAIPVNALQRQGPLKGFCTNLSDLTDNKKPYGICQVEFIIIKKPIAMEDNEKVNIPETPEPPQRIYPVPESAKAKGKEKRKPNDKRDKERRKSK